jgi:hypothetical protein
VGLRKTVATLLGLLPALRTGLPYRAVKADQDVAIRKIVGIEDKEGKTRVIAIGDYWSQTALRPLHLWVFRILRRIRQDVTFDQGSFRDKVSKWPAGATLYSVDLTSATDRFPICLIADVLKGVLPEKYVSAWQDVMVGYTFQTPEGTEVRYSVGNPMGFYSSWGSFALAHHFVVFWCCQEIGVKWSGAKYVVLGDDILIGDEALGEAYRAKIQTLGVEVSPAKTFVSKDLCEFAKRYLFQGTEVTPYPISSVVGNLGDVSLLVSAIWGEGRKGLVPRSGIPGAVGTLYDFLGRRKENVRHAVQRARDCELATQLIQGTISPVEFTLLSCGARTPEEFDFIQSMGMELFSLAVRSIIQKSLESGSRTLESDVYHDLLEAVTRIRSAGGTGWEALDIPLFAVYASFEEEVEGIHSLGFTESVAAGNVDFDVLSSVVVDPLRESSWGLGRRERSVRGISRLARACREVRDLLLKEGGTAIVGRYQPPMPMAHTLRYWASGVRPR